MQSFSIGIFFLHFFVVDLFIFFCSHQSDPQAVFLKSEHKYPLICNSL